MSDGYTECPHCHAAPSNGDERVITGSADGSTSETWHTDDCPRPQHGARLRLVRPDEEPTP